MSLDIVAIYMHGSLTVLKCSSIPIKIQSKMMMIQYNDDVSTKSFNNQLATVSCIHQTIETCYVTDKQTDRQKHTQTHRQTHRQTDRQTDERTEDVAYN